MDPGARRSSLDRTTCKCDLSLDRTLESRSRRGESPLVFRGTASQYTDLWDAQVELDACGQLAVLLQWHVDVPLEVVVAKVQ